MSIARDLAPSLEVAESIRPAVHNATVNGETVDLRGANSAAVVFAVGTVTGSGNVTPKLQHSADGTSWSDVPADKLSDAFPAQLAQNSTFIVGYRGHNRYLRAVGTFNSGTSVAYSAVILRGHLAQRPIA
jgi:hypothetical protein